MRVLFVSSGNKKNQVNPIIHRQGESLVNEGINLEYFPIKGKGLKGYLKNIKPLRNFLKQNHFDVVHAHYGVSGIVSLFACGKQKLVVSMMGDDILGSSNISGKNTFKSNLIAMFNKLCARFYHSTIVKSKEMQQLVGLPAAEVNVIPNGVDFNVFYRVNRHVSLTHIGWSNDVINLLFLGDPSRNEKNYRLAKAATDYVQKSNEKVKLHVVNSLPTPELKFYYSAANVLLLTSFHEGSPNVIKEAMACGCPIVATNVGDIAWLFENTEGCFMGGFEVEQFATVLKTAIDFSLKYELSQGKQRLQELQLSAPEVARKIISLYQNLLK